MGFPGGSDGKVSARSAGDPGLIPGLRRSPGEGDGKILDQGTGIASPSLLPAEPQGFAFSSSNEGENIFS